MKKDNHFLKPALTVEQQLGLLRSRGLLISDEASARQHLQFISYYRFCSYGSEFEEKSMDGKRKYLPHTNFTQILDAYVFDRKLRLLVIDAIERIEIAIRTLINNELALKYGAHWYLDSGVFLKRFRHDELIHTIKKQTSYLARNGSTQHKRREHFIQQYFDKYTHPELPAAWMVAEILSLGTWSQVFSNLKHRADQKLICKHFSMSPVVMGSWLHSLTYLRNLCAHHSKLWSRNFTLKPKIANDYHDVLKNNARFSAQAIILKVFLDTISPDNHWLKRLQILLHEHPNIDVSRMGFEGDWHTRQFWNIDNPISGVR